MNYKYSLIEVTDLFKVWPVKRLVGRRRSSIWRTNSSS
jgi:hypothetical protein